MSEPTLFSYGQAVDQPAPVDAGKPASELRFERILANCTVIAFISVATIVGVAEFPFVPEKMKGKLISPGAPIGMRQAWRLFGPELRSFNWHNIVLIQFADGTVKVREFPRMEKLSLVERFFREKERSILNDRIAFHVYKRFWPSVARYVARANSDPSGVNPPVTVTFIFASAPIPKPDPDHWVFRDNMPEHLNRQAYFIYRVEPADLK
jgi:hypothetical protein